VSAQALLEELRRRDVILQAAGSLLHVDAPVGAVTEELRAALVEHKQGLIKLLAWERRRLEEANRCGLVVCWSEYPTWIKIHDPLAGEWHEVRAEECLPGVVQAADKYLRHVEAERN
jgi:TubC N-terminal docking domain